jgi:predicted  nucleic acid-binding Zn-ribbon protein
VDDGGAQQAAKSLRKFQERIVALQRQKVDIDEQIAQLKLGCEAMEQRLATRPDLLPRAADYDQMLRRQLDGAEHEKTRPSWPGLSRPPISTDHAE